MVSIICLTQLVQHIISARIMEPVIGWTTHHSIVEIDGEWYLFYHDSEYSEGCSHKRCVKFTKLTIHEDGTIDTIIPYDHM